MTTEPGSPDEPDSPFGSADPSLTDRAMASVGEARLTLANLRQQAGEAAEHGRQRGSLVRRILAEDAAREWLHRAASYERGAEDQSR